jgi:hypothetical protein
MHPNQNRLSIRTLPIALSVLLIALALASPLAASTAQQAGPSLTADQIESAEGIAGFLGQPVLPVVLTGGNAIDAETVGFQQTLRDGTLTVEIEWYENDLLTDGVVVELYPAQWTDFRGVYGTGRQASAISRDSVGNFLVDRGNRTFCGYRDMEALGQVVFPDGDVQVRTLGLTWQWSGAEMTIADMAAAGNTSCPLNHRSAKCQNHVACVVTINCGISSFDVDGRCMPQFPFGWPCLCDPLHDLVCNGPHQAQPTQD